MGGLAAQPSLANPADRPVGADVDDEVLLARAFLTRIAEPACIPLWGLVRRVGAVEAVRQIKAGIAADEVMRATAPRLAETDPHADLDIAQRYGIRLIVPESAQWPHFAMSALERTGAARLREYENGKTTQSEAGEDIPPLALWVRGTAELHSLGVRSVGIVGARAATAYGERVAADLASGLGARGFPVVSGGAYGIDAAAHRGALAAGAGTVVVSAGGLDKPYPASNHRLFELAAETGLLVSESPPGAAPRRRRFLTRNRLIAALSTGCVIVEASTRSGAGNTATHCLKLGRHLMVVPGPVTSAMSAGCHDLLRKHEGTVRLVTNVADVVEHIGTLSELIELSEPATADPRPADTAAAAAPADASLRQRLDALDATSRALYDSFGARRSSTPEELVSASGQSIAEILRGLALLEGAGLIERRADGFRIVR
ncbi:MAG TPA: DNA-processing protein DprA [Jatrophihabitans sp.]|nr:DNA-processing protein DprA [Jatrophihabitans sp.]